MKTEHLKLKATAREVSRKGVLQGLRRTGRVPAVLYGRKTDPISFSVSAKELGQLIHSGGVNALIELELGGQKEKNPLVVMIKDYQTDVLSHRMIHLDFIKVDMKAKVNVRIPIHLHGKAIGVEKGGLVEQQLRELEVQCLPGNIPEGIDLDITSLELGHSIHLKELKLPEGVEFAGDAALTVVSIVAPKEEVVEAAPAAAEVAATPEATATAGAPGAEPHHGATPPAAAEKKEEKKETKKEEKK